MDIKTRTFLKPLSFHHWLKTAAIPLMPVGNLWPQASSVRFSRIISLTHNKPGIAFPETVKSFAIVQL